MQLFANNADSELNGAIASNTLSLTLKVGGGAKFPSPTGGDFFLVTLYEKVGATETNHEIVKCTARNGDVLTVVRAQEGTVARAFANADPVELRSTAGTLASKADVASAYVHPASHPPSIITQDASNRFVTDVEKAAWNAKQAAGTYATGTGSATGTNTGDNAVNSLYSGLVNYTHPVNHPASIITQDASNRFVTDAEKTTWNAKGVGADVYTYDNRATLRSLSPTANDQAIVEGLGLFAWYSASAELDDGETCFATASGRWLLTAAAPEYVHGFWTAEMGRNDKFLRGSFTMSLTTLAATTSTAFTATVTGAAVGDSVVATPGNVFGTTTANASRLSFAAHVSAPNTVTISIRNASAASAAMTTSTWQVLVIKP